MIPKLWPNSTIVCIGNGPSARILDPDARMPIQAVQWPSDPVFDGNVASPHPDVMYCRGRARVLAITRSFSLAPWADALMLRMADPIRVRKPHRLGLDTSGHAICPVRILPIPRYVQPPADNDMCCAYIDESAPGLSADSSVLHGGHDNKGFTAINAAVHLGARRIVLLGYDHSNGAREYPGYETLVEPLRELGIEVLNASGQTELTVFPRVTLAEALVN